MQETQQTNTTNPMSPNPTKPIMKQFPTKPVGRDSNAKLIGLALVVVVAGVATGWVLAGSGKSGSTGTTNEPVAENITQTKNEAGVEDTADFPDEVEGKLVEGGFENEGTHHLERDGGPSQNVYLSSTVVDLQSFVGKKVKVWGQTISGQKAGWLMDVGKVRVIE